MRIAIVGGGIGGVAAALFLRQAGLDATVYEQAAEPVELGAGIVVAPNMVRLLRRLGLAGELAACAVRLEAAWEFRRWRDGRVLFVQPMGETCERLYGAHCYVAHRADLLALLQRALPPQLVRFDQRCVGAVQDEHEVQLTFVDRAGRTTAVTADAVVGADGIHSAVRQAIAADVVARFSGLCAFRCLVPADQAPGMALRPVQTLWLGPGHHFVHYPISRGRLVNIVAFAPAGDWRTESWTADGEIADLLAEFDGWDARLAQLIASATTTKRWAVYDRDPLAQWTRGRVTLLGDAAHPMLPFFAQGAAQAVEDAAVLAGCLRTAGPDSVRDALQRYERLRRPRATQVQLMSRGREVQNHLPDGPEQEARDAQLANGRPLLDNAWLYGHDVEADLQRG
ncbi:MAG: salicylate 1-monooxygenase [Deltaproteobacteria bacterium]|nr:MAG: salicylate 1-monooxygenase [Deltaproteobacteria bacterium]TMQ27721.1 MAG: salicylate 1-monooxygenase [Deltaproteobacteria bacterium]